MAEVHHIIGKLIYISMIGCLRRQKLDVKHRTWVITKENNQYFMNHCNHIVPEWKEQMQNQSTKK